MSDSAINLGSVMLSEGEMRGYAVDLCNVLIARYGGVVRALDDACNHGGCLLSTGRIEGHMVICPCHHVGFDLVTGKNITSPGICGDQPVFRAVEDRDGKVIVYASASLPEEKSSLTSKEL